MKKNYDLSIIGLGLEKQAFFFFDVMPLFYGPYNGKLHCKRVDGELYENSYEWVTSSFDRIPLKTRQKLIRILFKRKEFAERDVDFLDEFYGRIYCTLLTLLDQEKIWNKEKSFYSTYHCDYDNDYITLVAMIKEFFMWHRLGLPVSSAEKKLLERCLAEIMPDTAFEDDNFAVLLKQKKNELRRQLRYLKTRMKCLNASIKMGLDAGEDEDIAEGKVLCKKLWEVEDRIHDVRFYLALSEVYPILSADFPVYEDIFPR